MTGSKELVVDVVLSAAGSRGYIVLDASGGGHELRVETGSLSVASDELQSIDDGLRDALGRLVCEAGWVVEGSWRGEAANAFAREQQMQHFGARNTTPVPPTRQGVVLLTKAWSALAGFAFVRRTGLEITRVYGHMERAYNKWTEVGKPERTYQGTLREP